MLVVAGLTVTDATGTRVTVTAAVPLLPSLVAVIVADPAATPVTSPLVLTVATAGVPLAQVITRPESGFPFASSGVAATDTVCPVVTDAVAGLTLTDATATVVTVSAAVPVCPPVVAVMFADPARTAVANPLPFIVATAVSLLPHVIVRPESGFPLESEGVALSCAVCPTLTVAKVGVTVTDATGLRRTCTRAASDIPSVELVALTEKSPVVVSAVNSPVGPIVPPVADQPTGTATVSPAAVRP